MDDAIDMLVRMEELGLPKNQAAYARVVTGLGRAGRAREAAAWLFQMEEAPFLELENMLKRTKNKERKRETLLKWSMHISIYMLCYLNMFELNELRGKCLPISFWARMPLKVLKLCRLA